MLCSVLESAMGVPGKGGRGGGGGVLSVILDSL